MWLLQGGLYVK